MKNKSTSTYGFNAKVGCYGETFANRTKCETGKKMKLGTTATRALDHNGVGDTKFTECPSVSEWILGATVKESLTVQTEEKHQVKLRKREARKTDAKDLKVIEELEKDIKQVGDKS